MRAIAVNINSIFLKSMMMIMLIHLHAAPISAQDALWDKLTLFDQLKSQVLELDQKQQYTEALKAADQSVKIGTEIYGPNHPEVELSLKNLAAILNNLAEQYVLKGKYDEAEPIHQRALIIREDVLGIYFPDLEQSLYNLANVYRAKGRYAEATSLLKRALTIREKALGKDHPSSAIIYETLAKIYKKIGKSQEAIEFEEYAKKIRLSNNN